MPEWTWTERDEEVLRIWERQNSSVWLVIKLRAALQEIDRLQWDLNDERTAAKHVAIEAIRRTKEAVKAAIRKAPPTWRATELKHIEKAIDEAEV